MSTKVYSPLNIVAFGWAMSLALIVLFVMCLVFAIAIPSWNVSHAWVGLFSTAPMTSARVWIEGVVYSFGFGWIAAAVIGLVYNRLIAR